MNGKQKVSSKHSGPGFTSWEGQQRRAGGQAEKRGRRAAAMEIRRRRGGAVVVAQVTNRMDVARFHYSISNSAGGGRWIWCPACRAGCEVDLDASAIFVTQHPPGGGWGGGTLPSKGLDAGRIDGRRGAGERRPPPPPSDDRGRA